MWEVLPRYPGTPAIVEVKCSQALVEEIDRLGGRPFFYRTGHSLIKAKMKEVNAPFTGEMSGHLFFAGEYYGFDDAFYATGRLLRILSRTEKTLAQLLAGIPQYYGWSFPKGDPEGWFWQWVESLLTDPRVYGPEIIGGIMSGFV